MLQDFEPDIERFNKQKQFSLWLELRIDIVGRQELVLFKIIQWGKEEVKI